MIGTQVMSLGTRPAGMMFNSSMRFFQILRVGTIPTTCFAECRWDYIYQQETSQQDLVGTK